MIYQARNVVHFLKGTNTKHIVVISRTELMAENYSKSLVRARSPIKNK